MNVTASGVIDCQNINPRQPEYARPKIDFGHGKLLAEQVSHGICDPPVALSET
jgi:hypothetical protein